MQVRQAILGVVAAGVLATAAGVSVGNAPIGKQMADAANTLLDSLSADLKAQATFPFDDPERINWHFIPRERKGLVMKALDETQREHVKKLLATGTSAAGASTALSIMTHEAILREIENTPRARIMRDPELYYVTIFGTPGPKGSWGWRIEGHHLALNYVIRDGELVAETPIFFGANPAKVPEGPHKGLRILAPEEDLARKLFTSLEGDARAKALLAEKAPADVESGTQNTLAKALSGTGLAFADMSKAQQEMLSALIDRYVDRFPAAIAAAMRDELQKAGVDKVAFGWFGPPEVGQPHAYRVTSPAFLIEYNNTQNGANHIHSLWRRTTGDLGVKG